MSDTTDLVSTVGNWVAVALGLIALIGVLPAYIVYRQTHSTHYQAISAIDDQHQKFINGFRLLPRGKRVFYRISVPDLRDPFRLDQITFSRQKCQSTFDSRLPYNRSQTGWINFLTVLRAYDIQAANKTGGKLEIIGREAVFPVHRIWILLLGVIDRYGNRDDFGLFQGESRDEDISWLFRTSQNRLYGLSGLLDIVSPLVPRDEQDMEPVNICFRMHSTSHMSRLGENDPPFRLRTLILLYLGFVPQLESGTLYELYYAGFENTPETGFHRIEFPIWKFVKRQMSYHYEGIFREMGIQSSNVLKLTEVEMSEEEMRICGVGQRPPVLQRPQMIPQPRPACVERRYYYSNEDGVYMLRSDIYSALRAVLDVGCNPQGFLCKSSLAKSDLITSMFTPRLFVILLTWASRCVTSGSRLAEADAESLRTNINGIKRLYTRNRSRRSRELLKRFAQLEEKLRHHYRQLESLGAQAVTILYVLDKDFRNIDWEEGINQIVDDNNPEPELLNLDFDAKEIKNDRLVGENSFFFDFSAVFPDSKARDFNGSIPCDVAIMAFLRGYLIMATWSMYLPADDLERLYAKMDSIVHVSSRTAPSRRSATLEATQTAQTVPLQTVQTVQAPRQPTPQVNVEERPGSRGTEFSDHTIPSPPPEYVPSITGSTPTSITERTIPAIEAEE